MHRISLLIVAAVGATAGVSLAAPITVVNPSFESPDIGNGYTTGATGWTAYGVTAGVFQPDPNGEKTMVPSGDQINLSGFNQQAIQILTATVQPNTVYTLSTTVVGRRFEGETSEDSDDTTNYGGFYIRLGSVESSTTLALLQHTDAGATIPNLANGFNALNTLTYTSPSSGGPVGETLLIQLYNPSGGTQVGYDNVSLDASPVPEPGTLAVGMAGLIGMGLRRRSRQR